MALFEVEIKGEVSKVTDLLVCFSFSALKGSVLWIWILFCSLLISHSLAVCQFNSIYGCVFLWIMNISTHTNRDLFRVNWSTASLFRWVSLIHLYFILCLFCYKLCKRDPTFPFRVPIGNCSSQLSRGWPFFIQETKSYPSSEWIIWRKFQVCS